MTMQIGKDLQNVLETEDVAIVIDAKHLCVASRGVEDDTSSTITAFYGGKFKEDKTRNEFLRFVEMKTEF
jgi:GTP cyclohydrolase I